MSLVCQFGGQGTALQNMTCPGGAEYCGTVLKEGQDKDQKAYSCMLLSSLKELGYTKTPGETLTCQEITVDNMDGEVCACTKDYCNYGSTLKVSKRNFNLV